MDNSPSLNNDEFNRCVPTPELDQIHHRLHVLVHIWTFSSDLTSQENLQSSCMANVIILQFLFSISAFMSNNIPVFLAYNVFVFQLVKYAI